MVILKWLVVVVVSFVISRVSQYIMEYVIYKEVSWRRMFSVGYDKGDRWVLYISDLIVILGMIKVISLVDMFGIGYGVVGLVLLIVILFTWITDIREMLILDVYTYPGMALLLLGVIFIAPNYVWWVHLFGGLGIGLMLVILYTLSKGKMGLGDVKLMIGLGFYFGLFDIILVMLVASVVGLVVGLVLIKLRGESREYPFGPFIVLGVLVVWLGELTLLV